MMNTVYSQLDGRLGNLLFEIGTGLSYAEKYKKEFKILNGDKMISYPELYSRFVDSIHNGDTVDVKTWDDTFNTYREIPDIEGSVLLRGYFQGEQRLNTERTRSLYRIKNDTKIKLLEKYPGILDGVGVHVRRGDYIRLRNLYNLLNADYYTDMYNTYFRQYACFVASDDLSWCKSEINIPGVKFIDESAEDSLYALSLCHHHILSSSTFSWWGAWLDEKSDAINISPDSWFRNGSRYTEDYIIPDRWIKIEVKDRYIIK